MQLKEASARGHYPALSLLLACNFAVHRPLKVDQRGTRRTGSCASDTHSVVHRSSTISTRLLGTNEWRSSPP